jgi:hypothetical protein
MSTKTLKARSLPLPEKTITIYNKSKSSPIPKKNSRTPTAVKFTEHANKMIDLKALLNNLPDDLQSRITRKAILEKTVQQKDMYKRDDDYVILDRNISIKKIIEAFELDYFNYTDKDEYKYINNKRVIIKDNETILADIYSTIGEEPDSLPVTHMYCYKTLKIINSDKYEIILTHIPINDINATKEEYIRKTFLEEDINTIDFEQPQLHIRERTLKHNNIYYIKDEHYKEIIKKLKYKDLINIFNPKIEDYSKVVKTLKEQYTSRED